MDAQDRVAEFVAEHQIKAPTEYRLLDLTSELGKLAKEANESTAYGAEPDDVELPADELGDATFGLLALCERANVDWGAARDATIETYESRLKNSETGESGNWPTASS